MRRRRTSRADRSAAPAAAPGRRSAPAAGRPRRHNPPTKGLEPIKHETHRSDKELRGSSGSTSGAEKLNLSTARSNPASWGSRGTHEVHLSGIRLAGTERTPLLGVLRRDVDELARDLRAEPPAAARRGLTREQPDCLTPPAETAGSPCVRDGRAARRPAALRPRFPRIRRSARRRWPAPARRLRQRRPASPRRCP